VDNRVLQEIKKMEEAQIFCNLLWANLPKCFSLSSVIKNKTIKVYITNHNIKNKRKNKKTRTYSFNEIDERKDDLWGLARDFAEEIKNDFQNK